MDIYIKPVSKVQIVEKRAVRLKDIAEVYCSDSKASNVGDLIVYNIPSDSEKRSYLISSMDIVKLIDKNFQNATVNNMGEMDILIEYHPVKSKNNKVLEIFKIVFTCIVLFGGAMTAIMSFHSDSQIPAVFQNMYRIFFGVEATKPYIIYIPYSVGLASGIIIFFNHFVGRKITNDPTPIEVQMTTYDKEITSSIVDSLSKGTSNGDI